jgi:dihydrofolate reductase
MAATDAHLFGRKTYETMAAYWPTAPSDDPFAKDLNTVRKYVASRTLQSVEWQNSMLIRGDVAEEVANLKQQPGKDIALCGSGNLVQTLMRNDLVDEYSLSVFPIVLGSGKRLFREDDQTRNLRLVDSKTTSTGDLILAYQPARCKDYARVHAADPERPLGPGWVTWAAKALREQKMPADEIRAVLTTPDRELIHRYPELHRERLEEGLMAQRRTLTAVERLLVAAAEHRRRT